MGYRGVPYRRYKHAQDRQDERAVSNAEIRAILDSPDVEYPSESYPGRRVLCKKFSETRKVSVVIWPPTKGDADVKVVTVTVN